MAYHWGPQIAKIPVKGVMGAVFAVGVVLMMLAGVPEARLFALISVPVGVILGIVLYLWHRRRPVEIDDIDPPGRK